MGKQAPDCLHVDRVRTLLLLFPARRVARVYLAHYPSQHHHHVTRECVRCRPSTGQVEDVGVGNRREISGCACASSYYSD